LQDRSDIVDGFPVRQIIIWKRDGGNGIVPMWSHDVLRYR
jgi:hypothetical protein